MPELPPLNNFYVILGSSAGALIGLQFVVVALIADLPHARAAFQAWLDGGPDDPHGEERARAALAR